jgi:hypothetical protein
VGSSADEGAAAAAAAAATAAIMPQHLAGLRAAAGGRAALSEATVREQAQKRLA